MKTITINLYSFNELSEEAKQKAINQYNEYDLPYPWYDSIYSDSADIGVKITGFDLYVQTIEGILTKPLPVIIDLILNNYGATTKTYSTALFYQKKLQTNALKNNKTKKHKEGEGEGEGEKVNELEEQFLQDILKNYLEILQSEYDYLTSDEGVAEILTINEWVFDENGNIRNDLQSLI